MTKPISRLNLAKPNNLEMKKPNLEMAKPGKEEISIYNIFIKKLEISKQGFNNII